MILAKCTNEVQASPSNGSRTQKRVSAELIREIAQMENLRGLTLQQVCIIETHEESVEGVLHLEHVRLLDTRWHGPNNESGFIRACKDLKTLEFTWDRSRIRALESGEKWWNETCQSVKVYSRRSSWSSAEHELDAERQTFVDVIGTFKAAKMLDIQGWIPVFKHGDASNESLSNAITHFAGPIRFLKFSRRLPNLRILKLSDYGLVRGEVDELDLQVAKVNGLEVNVYASDKETLCMMLAVMNDVRELKVNFCDNVNEPDVLLRSIADMLDFNPPIERLCITADDPFVTTTI
ncbi:uncharacterized protein C8R40DRAFT_1178146 [Lentinula edodes]|uniref:uncharacterized protein n=1 Tax=Lentinula edodes TaxID=5353 RepID=UPI001E8EE536|nr:uncharacterized protein C8R40DRAFT_1178146 [Lentinula edodes]KAH7868207.1 hypothetical protein C8R40DRAFT_1178146 [Lentinula edodes]